ncbi:zinc transport system permease protein [Tistlia consotensis]|uniref:High-affinity zinc uptake system membrane protein ZnuB n=1 Tax=Tistlia consotensis USBA 355 TaxID=560819 RepID=A0A1Y6CAK1_9PROT|nr:metal ABC transporter permease [Tistlia consotensis]SMF53440.1 zinc transport system permease protein [Tistlia consotensis USBA 355]SNR85524.1 zinc transport system permease protein [Tistlia consotensis]
MLDDFLVRALLAGFGVALIAGPLGCLVVWRRMAYLGDSLAHSALLGIALGLLLDLDTTLAIVIAGLAFAVLLVGLQQQRQLATDTLLGLLAHSGLAIGLVVLSFAETLRVDLMGYLFGDVLAVRAGDLAWIWGGGAVLLAALVRLWRPLLLATIQEEMARAEGLPVLALRFGLTVLLALTVALAMKVVGILLITSLLIVPAAAARPLARSPEAMALVAAGLGCLAVAGGIGGSWFADTPTGPSIVVAALLLFLVTQAAAAARHRLPRRASPG